MMSFLLLSALVGPAAPDPTLPLLSPVFGDHMVLQRDRKNTFWGWAKPGTRVKVTLANRTATGVAQDDGRWEARIEPPKPGGPYEVVVEGPQRVELKDVLVGDVWICSGQSNMEFGLSQANNGDAEVAAANEPNLRLFMVGRQVGYVPKPLPSSGQWKVCSPETVKQDGWGGFSAVGYNFGKRLQKELGVPIGLVQVAWGGTSGEAWASEKALRPLNDFDRDFDRLSILRKKGVPVYGTYTDLWLADHDTLADAYRTDFPEKDWATTTVPDGFTSARLEAFDGTVWFRRTVDLPANLPVGDAKLMLGQINETDTTYVNGQLVGTTKFEWAYRQYRLPSGLLKPGRNVIAVRVFDTGSKAGFLSNPNEITLQLGDGTRIPLNGEWKFKVGANMATIEDKPKDREPNPTLPSVLNNGMIAPVAPLAIRGAIWYQGETNSGRSAQYERILPALINDWRRMFDQGDFPFYIVSLANWQAHREDPTEDGWTELREAQARTADRVKNSGLAITVDVGDPNDVHPRDKQTVANRLAAIALAREYGRDIPYSGPVYKSKKVEGRTIRLKFDHVEGGLVAKGDRLAEFSIAGKDRRWVWADARIDGDTIVVSSPEVSEPVAVRYAWQMNPRATLYNGAGFPAVPFRTDDWPRVTENNK